MKMRLYIFFCNILFIPIITGTNATKVDHNLTTKSLLPKESSKAEVQANKINVTVMTEGGTPVQSTPSIVLPKQNDSVLLSLDNELGRDKSVQSSGSNVKPRKGVVYHIENTTTGEDVSQRKEQNVTASVKHMNAKSEQSLRQNTTLGTVVSSGDTKAHTNPAKSSGRPAKVNTTVAHKPLLLSNEPLDKMELNTNVVLPKVISTTKTIASDQMPSPNNDNGTTKRTKPSNLGGHPGMMMPVVISILVVPMFAVLGYMALKRGQEAWKNRHYKRMDFLLDGMYNE